MKQILCLGAAALSLIACATEVDGSQPTPTNAEAFFQSLAALCRPGIGYPAYSGKLVSADAADADFAEEILTAHFPTCTPNEIRIPFEVGEDRSRTWVITLTDTGLRLKHDHRHTDGSEDAVSQYGGDTVDAGSTTRQEFPADEFSKDLFRREGLDVSVNNVWAMEVTDEIFVYELRRPNRFFRVEFDVTDPAIVLPPARTAGE